MLSSALSFGDIDASSFDKERECCSQWLFDVLINEFTIDFSSCLLVKFIVDTLKENSSKSGANGNGAIQDQNSINQMLCK